MSFNEQRRLAEQDRIIESLRRQLAKAHEFIRHQGEWDEYVSPEWEREAAFYATSNATELSP